MKPEEKNPAVEPEVPPERIVWIKNWDGRWFMGLILGAHGLNGGVLDDGREWVPLKKGRDY